MTGVLNAERVLTDALPLGDNFGWRGMDRLGQ